MAQGEAEVRLVAVGTEVIDVEELRRAVSDPAAGASVVFTGDVRDNDHERSVVSLTYEAHPGAQAALGDVAADVEAALAARERPWWPLQRATPADDAKKCDVHLLEAPRARNIHLASLYLALFCLISVKAVTTQALPGVLAAAGAYPAPQAW